MNRAVAFAYPGTRLQAHFGRLLGDAQWDRLLRIADYTSFVQTARETALRPWVQSFGPQTQPHQIEAQLRGLFRQRVHDFATWCPSEWRPAVEWVAQLPDLSAAAHILAGIPEPAWVAADLRLNRLGTQPGRASAKLAEAWRAGRDLPDAWLERWFELWPPAAAQDRVAADALVATLRRAARAGTDFQPAALRTTLRRMFRRNAQAPVGVFAFLALLWLELARLRGALMRRRLALPVERAA